MQIKNMDSTPRPTSRHGDKEFKHGFCPIIDDGKQTTP